MQREVGSVCMAGGVRTPNHLSFLPAQYDIICAFDPDLIVGF